MHHRIAKFLLYKHTLFLSFIPKSHVKLLLFNSFPNRRSQDSLSLFLPPPSRPSVRLSVQKVSKSAVLKFICSRFAGTRAIGIGCVGWEFCILYSSHNYVWKGLFLSIIREQIIWGQGEGLNHFGIIQFAFLDQEWCLSKVFFKTRFSKISLLLETDFGILLFSNLYRIIKVLLFQLETLNPDTEYVLSQISKVVSFEINNFRDQVQTGGPQNQINYIPQLFRRATVGITFVFLATQLNFLVTYPDRFKF